MIHTPVAHRRSSGWTRHYADCPCGWSAEGRSKEDAAARVLDHTIVVASTAVLPLVVCDCYDPDLMEYGPTYPCPRCVLKDALDRLPADDRATHRSA